MLLGWDGELVSTRGGCAVRVASDPPAAGRGWSRGHLREAATRRGRRCDRPAARLLLLRERVGGDAVCRRARRRLARSPAARPGAVGGGDPRRARDRAAGGSGAGLVPRGGGQRCRAAEGSGWKWV